MRVPRLFVVSWILIAGLVHSEAFSQDQVNTCHKAFVYKSDEFAVADVIKICSDAEKIPIGYESRINTPVCDDKLCANVILMFYWDLAGNYVRFDTLPGKPLTKFDHKRFSDADYKKLDQILKDKNSMLRVLDKEDLVDKTVKVKATTVDAVTGATPQTIKNAVVEGAVYSSFTLWHFINGAVKDSMAVYTRSIYSDQIAMRLLKSENYESQLFALKQWSETDYELHADLLFQVIKQSVPLVRAYLITKSPLPFLSMEKNKALVKLFPELDGYSKSIFLNRITADRQIAITILPLMRPHLDVLTKSQLDQCRIAFEKFEIPGYPDLLKELH